MGRVKALDEFDVKRREGKIRRENGEFNGDR